jgi:prepilin peptidase CpaA
MTLYHALVLLPMFALLSWAAVHDLRTRRIPNLLNLVLFLTGLGLSFADGMWKVSPSQAGLGALVGFGLTLPLFLIGAVGGGDVKLLTALGTWLGPGGVLLVFLARAVIGLPIILTQAVSQGRLRILFRNTAMLAMGAAHAGETGIGHFAEIGKNAKSVDKPLPWAVPVLVATVWVVWLMG